jgi:hypothetical protein
MAFAPCATARKALAALSTEQLCLAEIAFSYGNGQQPEILEAIQAELHSRQPAYESWRWEAVPAEGFDVRVGNQGWRITPPYNAPL